MKTPHRVLRYHNNSMMCVFHLTVQHNSPADTRMLLQRIMGYIEDGKSQGATVHLGGARHGTEGYWIQPTIFTDTKPDMKIVREEIFGPVGVVVRFEDEEDVLRLANDSVYGLAAAVFSKDISRALTTAHKLKAGTVWVGRRILLMWRANLR